MRRTQNAFTVFLTMIIVLGSAIRADCKNVAILVGVDSYDRRGFSDLKCAERDVTALSKELKQLNFDTYVLTGSSAGLDRATRINILNKIDQVLKNTRKSDVIIVSLAGHGMQVDAINDRNHNKGDAFYCPVDAVNGDPETMLSLSHLLVEVLNKKGGRNIVLVDACRNAPSDPGRGGINGKEITVPEDTSVFFSCRAGQQAFEDSQKLQHGLFTYAVLKALRTATADGGTIRWFELVSLITENFSHPDIVGAIPRHRIQEPMLAGNMSDFVICDLDALKNPSAFSGLLRSSTPVEPRRVYFSNADMSMTGFWSGTYVYPTTANRSPVSFTTYFIQQGDTLTGFLREPNTFGNAGNPWLYATIKGRVNTEDGKLKFEKTYDGTGEVSHSVLYQGQLDKEGLKLTNGKWNIPGDWGGTVSLQRTSSKSTGKYNGLWNGTYYYQTEDARFQPVDFEMLIIQDGNRFRGFIREPNTFGETNDRFLYAMAEGQIDAATGTITFTKKYDGTGQAVHDVSYSGRISDDGMHLDNGRWVIRSDWQGRFQMSRFSH